MLQTGQLGMDEPVEAGRGVNGIATGQRVPLCEAQNELFNSVPLKGASH